MRNDKIIEMFINDLNYIINPSGDVYNKKGKKLGFTKQTEIKLRGTNYYYIKYMGKELKIHRIIYRKFVGKFIHNYEIHHKNSDTSDNSVDNLVQVSHKENIWYQKYKEIDYVE